MRARKKLDEPRAIRLFSAAASPKQASRRLPTPAITSGAGLLEGSRRTLQSSSPHSSPLSAKNLANSSRA